MFLTYGRNPQGDLVYISDAKRGAGCGLVCPYCAGELVARKGPILVHHFAHRGESCQPAVSSSLLPSYDGYYTAGLTAGQRRGLQALYDRYSSRVFYRQWDVNKLCRPVTFRSLVEKRYLGTITAPGGQTFAKLTPLGLAFAGKLSLAGFARFARSEIERARVLLEGKAGAEAEIARQILSLEQERIRQTSLYFLEILFSGRDDHPYPIHKIGITTRPVEERIKEVSRFLASIYGYSTAQIRSLFVIPQVPFVEGYFKAKFEGNQIKAPDGRAWSVTEYFDFDVDRKTAAVVGELAELEELARTNFGATPTLTAGNRSRFRATFQRYEAVKDDFSSHWKNHLLLSDVIDLATGLRWGEFCLFAEGKGFKDLEIERSGVTLEFSATVEGDMLRRPGKIVKVEG